MQLKTETLPTTSSDVDVGTNWIDYQMEEISALLWVTSSSQVFFLKKKKIFASLEVPVILLGWIIFKQKVANKYINFSENLMQVIFSLQLKFGN